MTLGMHHLDASTLRRAHPLRCAAVWLAATALALLVVAWSAPDLASAVAALRHGAWLDLPFDRLLVELCATVLAGCTAWLWVVTTVVTWEAAVGGRARRGVPGGVRRAVLAACGVALASGLAAPALASPTDVGRPGPPEDALRGLRLPDRAVGGAGDRARHPIVVRAPAQPAPAGAVVRVGRGDTLWDLAAAHLPAGASDADVAAACRALYVANRGVVGGDPDLIRPGEVLHLPDRGAH